MQLKGVEKIVLFLLFGVTPLLTINLTLDRELFPRLIFASVLMISGILFINKSKISTVNINRYFFGVVLLLIAFLTISFIRSPLGLESFFSFTKILWFFCFTYFFFRYFRLEDLIEIIPLAVILPIFLLIIISFNQVLDLFNKGIIEIPLDTYEIKGLFGHRNLLAQYLILVYPFLLFNSFFSRFKFVKTASIILQFLMMCLVMLLSNRAAWIALFLIQGSLVVMFFIYYTKRNDFKKQYINTAKVLLLSWFIAVFIVVYFFKMSSSILGASQHAQNIISYNGSTKDHLVLWKYTLELIKEHFWLGSGLDYWKVEILSKGNIGLASVDLKTFYQSPHNEFLFILSEAGFVALIAFVVLLFIVLRSLIRLSLNENIERSFFMFSLVMIFIGLLVFMFFSFPLQRIETLLIFALLSGFGFYGKSINSGFVVTDKIAHWLLIAVASSAIYISIIKINSEKHIKKALLLKTMNNHAGVIEEIEKARNMFCVLDPTTTPLSWYTGSAYFNMGDVDKSKLYFEDALKIAPHHIHCLNNLATCFEINKNHSAAIQLYQKAIALSPNFNEAKLNLTATYYNAGSFCKAFKSLCTIDPKFDDVKFGKYISPVVNSAKMNNCLYLNNVEKKDLESILNDENKLRSWFFIYRTKFDTNLNN